MPRARQDRRRTPRTAPPYLTEEGMVLVDRREGCDRRAAPAGQGVVSAVAPAREPDLVRERLQRLLDLYGYQPEAGQAA
jgi:hypothetical protein